MKSGEARFPALCDCGTEFTIRFRGNFRAASCGCLQRESVVRTFTKHGGHRESLNRVWRGMRDRCSNPNRKEYPNYGGRGIKVCPEWDDYAVFRDWALSSGWVPGLDIDRIDNEGDYSPTNCRIVSRSTNLRNTRRARMLTAFGDTMCMSDWSEDPRCVVTYVTLESRLRAGWPIEVALTLPKGTRVRTLGVMTDGTD